MGTNERLCTKKRRERLSRALRVPLPPHHFCELDGRARIASSKGERFETRENAEHTRRLEETREVSRPKNHHIRLLGISKRRRHQCAIESTYNNRNRKRLKKWRRNESRKSLWTCKKIRQPRARLARGRRTTYSTGTRPSSAQPKVLTKAACSSSRSTSLPITRLNRQR